jgi:drug/metabolite transporter (DMT)-like permease
VSSAALLALHSALDPTIGGFILWYVQVSGAEASLFTAAAPASAVALAFVLLGEPVGLNQLLGIGSVILP